MGAVARRLYLSCRHKSLPNSAYVMFVYICIAIFYNEK